MKKIFVIIMSVVALTAFVSCSDKPVPADKLPAKAKTFLSTYFPGIDIVSVIKEQDGDYDVDLIDGTDVDFRSNGDWKKVDCGLNPLPAGILLPNTAKYLSAKFPMNFPTHVKYEHKRYEVEMDNDLDLVFDKNGGFMGADD